MPDPSPLRVALVSEQCWQPVPGGSGRYIVELSRELAEIPTVDAVGVAARHDAPPPRDWTPAIPVEHSRLPRRVLYDAWQRLPGPRAEVIAGGADLVHATTWAIPATRVPLVVTVHDVAFLHDPTHFTTRGNAFFRRALDRVRRSTGMILVPSQATADDLVRIDLPAGRIEVVPMAARVDSPRPDAIADFRSRHGLARDYVLWCGTVEPRKNLSGLLEGFARAAAHLPDLDLVIAGPAGWGEIAAVPAGLSAERVSVLGRLSAADLSCAYAGATAFCFPSLREGFGLPVLEAMQHGLPVVTSRGTSCAEVGGDAVLLVDPLDPEEIARALVTAVAERDDLAARSVQRAAQFSWRATAERTVEVYSSLLAVSAR